MATETFTHFVFVDFENIPSVDLGLVAGKPVHVTLLIGKKQTKLDTTLSLQLHRLAAQVEPLEVGASGRNALDLTLAFYLGKAVQLNPTAHFHIVSKDKDFEPMISHLTANGIAVARCDAIAALPFLAPPRPRTAAPLPRPVKVPAPARTAVPSKPAAQSRKQPASDRSAKIVARLMEPANRNRPATKVRLLAHLETALGKESSEGKVQDVFGELVGKHGLVVAANGAVIYPN